MVNDLNKNNLKGNRGKALLVKEEAGVHSVSVIPRLVALSLI